MIFANGYIAAAFIVAGLALGMMIAYAALRLRNAQRRLEALERRRGA
jgi:hypothetical protein